MRVAHVAREAVPADPGVEQAEVHRQAVGDQDGGLIELDARAVVVMHLIPFGQAAVHVLDACRVEALPVRLVLRERDAVIGVVPGSAGDVTSQHAAVIEGDLLLG